MGSNHSSERVEKEVKPFTEHQLSVADIETKEWTDPDIVSKLFFAEEDNHTQVPRWASNHDHFT